MILVRHAQAGSKTEWRQDDSLRPLTVRGRAQAAALVGSLANDAVEVVWSRAAVRCRQTVDPLAASRDVPVRDHPLLAKDAGTDALLDWLLGHETAPWVLCTHGEVFSALLVAARSSGFVTAPAVVTEKGAAWRVVVHENRPTELEYLPPLPRH